MPPKLLAYTGFLYKVVHKMGRLQKVWCAREIHFNFLTLSKPGFFRGRKTKGGGGGDIVPLAKTLLPTSESVQVKFFWKLVQNGSLDTTLVSMETMVTVLRWFIVSHFWLAFSSAEEEFWRWKKRKRREKKVEKAGIDPVAAAPSQPNRLDGSRSDHSAGSKESASWWVLRQRFGLTRSKGVRKREKEGKETSVREQPGQTSAREERERERERERQLKSAKREVISRAEEEFWRWKNRKRREKKVEKAGFDPAAAAPCQPDRLDGSRSDHSAGSKESASWRALTFWARNHLKPMPRS